MSVSTRFVVLLFAMAIGAGTFASAAMAVEPVGAAAEAGWVRHVIPLPKEIRIQGKLRLGINDVRVRLRDGAGELEKIAAAELAALFKEKGGAGSASGPAKFELLVGVCDAKGNLAGAAVSGAGALAGLPNADQAYLIRPIDAARLALTGLNERGLYYAVQTLRQLVESRFSRGTCEMPMAEVKDWPDLAERGEWGCGCSAETVKWFGAHKLNLIEYHASLHLDQQGRGVASVGQDVLDRARLHAVKLVPIIMHLDYLQASGIGERYPELKAVGKSAHNRSDTMPLCFSKPKTVEIVSDWICSLAALKGVSDVSVWLSEYDGQCGCEECERARAAGMPQHALETRAVAQALKVARRAHPALHTRVLLTQGTYPVNDRVLAAAQSGGVQVSYYCGGGRPVSTYDSSKEPMISPALAEFAARGNWLGVYPQFTASYGTVCPWSGPQFMKFRMGEFASKKLVSVCGYTVPETRLHEFNVAAAAEWSWNARGRSEGEFSAAWATRRGFKDPDRVAQWALLIGQVGWDIYGSGVAASPFTSTFRSSVRMVARREKPVLGRGLWRYFPSQQSIQEGVASAEKALAMAREFNDPALVAESEVIYGYMRMVREIYAIGNLAAGGDPAADDTRAKLQQAMCRLADAGVANVAALKAWERALGKAIGAPRYVGTLAATERTVADIGAVLAPYGIQDPSRPYRPSRIGDWQSERFEKDARPRLRWEVTRHLAAPGQYQVEFRYAEGANGLPIERVALASSPSDRPDELTELSVDKHPGFAGNENKANVYRVDVKTLRRDVRYFVVAQIHRTSSSNGEVLLRVAGEPPRPFPVPQLLPLTTEKKAQLRRPAKP